MRILESCIHAWPMPDVQKQIESLREAFSKDVNKAFELKPTFPYGSPISRLQPSPPVDHPYHDPTLRSQTSVEQIPLLQRYNSAPMTPPVSAGHDDSKDGSIAAASLAMLSTSQRQHSHTLPSSHSLTDENLEWNPNRIFEYGAKPLSVKSRVVRTPANPRRSQWNTAFGTPTSTMSAPAGSSMTQHSPTMYTPSSVGSHDLPQLQEAMQQPFSLPSNTPLLQQMQPPPPTSYAAAPSHPYISPSMWQETVASAYDLSGSLKRRWDMGAVSYDQHQVKRPR